VSEGDAGGVAAIRGDADAEDEAVDPDGEADGALGAVLGADPQAATRPATTIKASHECEQRMRESS
jgi:hypothetical protein